MERVYYPSGRRVLLFNYLLLPIAYGLGFGIRAIIDSTRNFPITYPNWEFAITLYLTWVGFNAFMFGIRGQKLAIRITPTTIAGPIVVSRDEPIRFDEIDYEKTRKKKRIYSVRGDQIRFEKVLFDPKDIYEIWEVLSNFERKKQKN